MSETAFFEEYPENDTYEYHFHRQYELIYIIKGSLTFHNDGEYITAQRGSIIITPPFIPHKEEYIGATVQRIVFESSYLYKYLSAKTARKLTDRFNSRFLYSAGNSKSLTEAISNIRDDIENFGARHSYIYLYKLIMGMFPGGVYKCKKANETVTDLLRYIKENSEQKLDLCRLCAESHLSRFYLCRLFKSELGITPVTYITFVKIKTAIEMLDDPKIKMSDISKCLSFSSPKYFTKIFKRFFSVSPSEYKKTPDNAPGRAYYLQTAK